MSLDCCWLQPQEKQSPLCLWLGITLEATEHWHLLLSAFSKALPREDWLRAKCQVSISRGKSIEASKRGEGRDRGMHRALSPGGWRLHPTEVGTAPGKSHAEEPWASPWSTPQMRPAPSDTASLRSQGHTWSLKFDQKHAVCPRGELFRKF